MIDNLPKLSPNAARAGRTLERCHDRLARHRRKQAPAERRVERDRAYERVLVTGLCVIHLIAVAGDILGVRGTSNGRAPRVNVVDGPSTGVK